MAEPYFFVADESLGMEGATLKAAPTRTMAPIGGVEGVVECKLFLPAPTEPPDPVVVLANPLFGRKAGPVDRVKYAVLVAPIPLVHLTGVHGLVSQRTWYQIGDICTITVQNPSASAETRIIPRPECAERCHVTPFVLRSRIG